MTSPPPEPNSLAAARAIFSAVLEQPLHARAAYLDQACAGNAAPRAEVAELLQWHENPASALAHPARVAAPRSVHATTTAVRTTIGESLAGFAWAARAGATPQPERLARAREAVALLRAVTATVGGQPAHKHTWPARIAVK